MFFYREFRTKLHRRQRSFIINRIQTKADLKEWLIEDSRNMPLQEFRKECGGILKYWIKSLFVGPLSDQKNTWRYIYALRHAEYHLNNGNIIRYLYYLWRLRVYSRLTGFQIEPNTVGKGLTIFHFGTIIINEETIIGDNLTIQPQVVFGWDGRHAPKVGNNVTVFGGSIIYGDITIGDNVTIGCNSYVCQDVPSNCIVAGSPAKIIKRIESSSDNKSV